MQLCHGPNSNIIHYLSRSLKKKGGFCLLYLLGVIIWPLIINCFTNRPRSPHQGSYNPLRLIKDGLVASQVSHMRYIFGSCDGSAHIRLISVLLNAGTQILSYSWHLYYNLWHNHPLNFFEGNIVRGMNSTLSLCAFLLLFFSEFAKHSWVHCVFFFCTGFIL